MSVFKGISYATPLTELHALCFAEPWSYENFCQLLVLPTTFGLGNENGFILCADLSDDFEILTLAVHPQRRRQGIASSLLQELQGLAQQQHKKHIFLEVNESNIAAQKLYVKNGFSQVGQRPNYYHENGNTYDALCLTWDNPRLVNKD